MELVDALRARAALIHGRPWEATASIAMMREAADCIEALTAARLTRDDIAQIVEPASRRPVNGVHGVHRNFFRADPR
jgi:hypothetical protein